MSDDMTNGNVTFTVKELLARQDIKLDTIIQELRSKADKGQVDQLEGRLHLLEKFAAETMGKESSTRWLWPLVVSLGSLALALYAVVGRV